jgi:hypothetical protein
MLRRRTLPGWIVLIVLIVVALPAVKGDPIYERNFDAVIVVLGVDPEPACPNGTPGDDVLVCRESPPTFDNPYDVVFGDAGNNEITILEGVTVAWVEGNGRRDNGSSGNQSGDNLIVNHGAVTWWIAGDNVADTSGGNDTIINHGTAGGIVGDLIGSVNPFSGGDDTITNHGTVNGDIHGDWLVADPYFPDAPVETSGGDNIITNNGLVTGSIFGSTMYEGTPGNNTIINHGTVQGDIYGNHILAGDPQNTILGTGGNNTITNNGSVGGSIYGEGGNDQITIAGTVGGLVDAGDGDDHVTLQDGANGGDDNHLFIDGGAGTNTLTFAFEAPDQATYDQWTAAINSADPAAGSITLNGQTFEWVNFSQLVPDFINLNPEPACPNGTPGDDVLVCRESPPTFDNPTSNLEGGQGNDHITILEDVTVATVHGDMIPGEEPLPVFDGGDNTIHNHGTVGGGTQGGIVGSMVLGRAGNNTIHNHETGTVATIIGDGGSGAPGFSQTITNDGLVTGDILGSLLLDDNLGGTVVTNTITNNGTVQGDLTGSRLIVQDPNTADQFYPGDHAITNSGIVEGDIYGNYTLLVIDNDWENATLLPDSAGDHIITSSGRVDGAIYAMGGDVILQDGANGGDDNHLFIDGGAGTNTLTFAFEAPDQATYDQWTAAINNADPAAGSITFNGQTFEWVNFSALDGQFSITGVSVSFTINNQELYHAIQGQIALNPNAVVEFVLPQIVPAGVQMTVRLTNGTLGRVTVSIEDGGGFAVIQIGDMQVGGSPAPASFVNPVHNELPGLIAGALDALIFEEAGAAQGLQSISISDNLIHITTQP